jgi:tetratricopeptide (TPR) repeat protein
VGGEHVSAPRLRLVIGREGVGLELARPVRLECLTVTELSATLSGVRFPVDVSGGVQRFRHRRGRLHTLQVEVGARALERWAAPRLLGVVGARSPDVWIGVRPGGAVVGVAAPVVADENDVERGRPAAPVVAFDIDVLPDRGDLIFVVSRARGADLPAPPTAIAIACADALFRGVAKREGALLLVQGGAIALARALFPEAGARAPDGEGVYWTSLGVHADTWILHAVRDALTAPPSEDALRAREVAVLLRDADEALLDADLERARTLSLEALERAPRHREIVRRVIEVDSRRPERAEAALAILAEATNQDDAGFGIGPGELWALTGDKAAAIASLERVGDTEPMPALAARAYERAARLTQDPEEAAHWLDRALARAARSTTARWMRVTKRLELGRIDDALSDVEHLEALVRGAAAKHTVWWRAGRAWQAAGLSSRAALLFERALRYAPEDPRALAGLGQALVEEGREERGIAALTRAIELAEMRAVPTSAMLLDLSRALAERLDDLPTAIARISAVPADAFEAPLARGLEGRWRARLGDLAGAALAFARLREMAITLVAGEDSAPAPPGDERALDARLPFLIDLLVEGANFLLSDLHDVRAAQRHLAAALRLRPHDSDLRQRYRELGAMIIRDQRALPHLPPTPTQDARIRLDPAAAPDTHARADDARAHARVEELTSRLRISPLDDTAADELASLLESLHRGHELLALLSARLDEAAPERRRALAPRARAALERLASDAESAGRKEEATLYRTAVRTLIG